MLNGITTKPKNNTIIEEEPEHVFVSSERLRQLELLESKLPQMIEAAIQEHKKQKLKMLHELDKTNPAAVNLRVKRYNERHRDEINLKRKEKRKLQKAALDPTTVFEAINTNITKIVSSRITNLRTNTELIVNHTIPVLSLTEALTVHFDT